MLEPTFQRATLGAPRRALARLSSAVLLALCAGSAGAEEAKPAPAAAPGVEVLYTGYTKNADHSASVFVRMTGEVPVETAQRPQQLTYHLSGARLKAPNNLNPLLTEHFGPPVSRISLVTAKDGVDLVIDLSAPSNGSDPASYKMLSRDGQSTLLVSFPAPSGS
jgi:hypothetical protein